MGSVYEMINITTKEHVGDWTYHLQNINACDRRLKTWMKKFHDAAAKYLDNWFGWKKFCDKFDRVKYKQVIAILLS